MTHPNLFATPDAPVETPTEDRGVLAVMLGRTPSELDRCDRYFDEWKGRGVMRLGVSWKTYRELRLSGRWNAYVDVFFPGRDELKAEEE